LTDLIKTATVTDGIDVLKPVHTLATIVADFGDVAVFCDSKSHFSATVWTGFYTCNNSARYHCMSVNIIHLNDSVYRYSAAMC